MGLKEKNGKLEYWNPGTLEMLLKITMGCQQSSSISALTEHPALYEVLAIIVGDLILIFTIEVYIPTKLKRVHLTNSTLQIHPLLFLVCSE